MKYAAVAFTALTCLMTWPQARHLSSMAPQHQDIYFNMWRLQWFAHAIVTSPSGVFNANIFHPELRTLALSDAMFVEGLFASPWLWLGARAVLVHNVTLFTGIAGSGLALFALVRYLTGSRVAGIVAGIVFAFAPFRFEHFMHMEMQWAMWSPLAFLALHRLYDTGALRYGLALGGCVALQMLSSIYYGIFLATFIGVAGLVWLPRDRLAPLVPVLRGLAAGALVAAVVCGLYARPYLRMHRQVGDRPEHEVAAFSATPGNYLSATAGNWLYGRTAGRGRIERHLFPGATAMILAVVALLLRVPGRRPIVYLLLLVAAFEASLGPRGYLYPFLHDYVPVYRGLRATARLGLFFLLFVGVLAGYGYQTLAAGRSRVLRLAAGSACVIALLAEYRVTLQLVPFPSDPPPIYRLLAAQPRGVVAEFPVPTAAALPGPDPVYTYMSTFHWFPLVNGYSGIYPGSYLTRLERLGSFPDETSITQLRRDGVRYVVLHSTGYEQPKLDAIRLDMERASVFAEVGNFPDGNGSAWLYRMR